MTTIKTLVALQLVTQCPSYWCKKMAVSTLQGFHSNLVLQEQALLYSRKYWREENLYKFDERVIVLPNFGMLNQSEWYMGGVVINCSACKLEWTMSIFAKETRRFTQMCFICTYFAHSSKFCPSNFTPYSLTDVLQHFLQPIANAPSTTTHSSEFWKWKLLEQNCGGRPLKTEFFVK